MTATTTHPSAFSFDDLIAFNNLLKGITANEEDPVNKDILMKGHLFMIRHEMSCRNTVLSKKAELSGESSA